ncbi:MAG: hypothetical protein HY678_02850, partial [Chloroflexi bacterium]|nr:hypothetical protein [Chloroflexota bacterium]
DVERMLAPVVDEYLARYEADGVRLLSGPVKYTQPVPVERVDGLAVFRTHVSAQAKYQVDESALARIKSDLPGQAVDQVDKSLAALPYMSRYRIELGFDPLAMRTMPWLSSRISVVLGDQAGPGS